MNTGRKVGPWLQYIPTQQSPTGRLEFAQEQRPASENKLPGQKQGRNGVHEVEKEEPHTLEEACIRQRRGNDAQRKVALDLWERQVQESGKKFRAEWQDAGNMRSITNLPSQNGSEYALLKKECAPTGVENGRDQAPGKKRELDREKVQSRRLSLRPSKDAAVNDTDMPQQIHEGPDSHSMEARPKTSQLANGSSRAVLASELQKSVYVNSAHGKDARQNSEYVHSTKRRRLSPHLPLSTPTSPFEAPSFMGEALTTSAKAPVPEIQSPVSKNISQRTSSQNKVLNRVFGRRRLAESSKDPKTSSLQQTTSAASSLPKLANLPATSKQTNDASSLNSETRRTSDLLSSSKTTGLAQVKPGLSAATSSVETQVPSNLGVAPAPPAKPAYRKSLDRRALAKYRRNGLFLDSEAAKEAKSLREAIEESAGEVISDQLRTRIKRFQDRIRRRIAYKRQYISFRGIEHERMLRNDNSAPVLRQIELEKERDSVEWVDHADYDDLMSEKGIQAHRKQASSRMPKNSTGKARAEPRRPHEVVDLTESENVIDRLMTQAPSQSSFQDKRTRMSLRQRSESTTSQLPSASFQQLCQRTRQSKLDVDPTRGLRPRFGLLETDSDYISPYQDRRLSEEFRRAIGTHVRGLLLKYEASLPLSELSELGKHLCYICFERLAHQVPQSSKRTVMAKGVSPDIVHGLENELRKRAQKHSLGRSKDLARPAVLASPTSDLALLSSVDKKHGTPSKSDSRGLAESSTSLHLPPTSEKVSYKTPNASLPSQSTSSSSGVKEQSSGDLQRNADARASVRSTRRRRSGAGGTYNLKALSKATLLQKDLNAAGSPRETPDSEAETQQANSTMEHSPSESSEDAAQHQKKSFRLSSPDPRKNLNLCEEAESLADLFAISHARSRAVLLRHRELGYGSARTLRSLAAEEMKCWRSWTGASKDILTAVWAPDGLSYAVGSSADMDAMNLQYNRGNNLLLGNLQSNTLMELDGHHIDRPRPETIASGSNSLQDTYNTVDSRLFTTVTSLCFDKQSKRLFSGSFDNTVKVWDISNPRFEPQTLQHGFKVELLGLSQGSEILATAQDSSVDSIGLFDCGQDRDVSFRTRFSSDRAQQLMLYPTALRWGPSCAENLLVAGFGADRGNSLKKDREGDICLWDVEHESKIKITPFAHMIFDVAWDPASPTLAAGLAPAPNANLSHRTTRSVVRVWEPRRMSFQVMECECPAADINEVQFNPTNLFYLSASCTDGSTYLWDLRREDKILHCFSHGKPIDPIDHDLTLEIGYGRAREELDTGVRFSTWDNEGRYLYTGASDGVIKCWDPYAETGDALVRNIAKFDSGVMTGSFSPDYTNILVGLSKGAVQILSCAPLTHGGVDDDDEENTPKRQDSLSTGNESIQYMPAENKDEDASTGVEAARELIDSGQIVVHPIWGAGKGPAYHGPYAGWARTGVEPALFPTTELDPDIRATQINPTDSLQKRLGTGIPFQPSGNGRSRKSLKRRASHMDDTMNEGQMQRQLSVEGRMRRDLQRSLFPQLVHRESTGMDGQVDTSVLSLESVKPPFKASSIGQSRVEAPPDTSQKSKGNMASSAPGRSTHSAKDTEGAGLQGLSVSAILAKLTPSSPQEEKRKHVRDEATKAASSGEVVVLDLTHDD